MEHDANIHALEGRLIAHRKLLVRLMAMLATDQRQRIDDWLENASIVHDGQEDPVAIPDEGAALELAMADELRLLREGLAVMQSQPDRDS